MDTEVAAGPDDESEPPNPPRHYSTGRLTAAQARVLNRWRRQLTTTDPRWRTRGQRPPASSSDCLAAAVIDLLDHAEPDHLELIRYAARIRESMTATRGRDLPAVSVVSFYLPGDYADRLDTRLTAAQEHHHDLLAGARDRVLTELPGATNTAQALRMMSVVTELGVPPKVYKLPAGTIARLAIDRWARRSPTTVVAAAVGYARHHHEQAHRARSDMGIADT
ncbi:hypothetical protein [Nocardia sp. CNY236]|uniref:hypothetical protein n=1 Tax=Nocardia sp. CNY236 TaxID=1169152 RepID=UPI0003F7DE67|nr:hypothetical protein [Nocardia sp. CNY236]